MSRQSILKHVRVLYAAHYFAVIGALAHQILPKFTNTGKQKDGRTDGRTDRTTDGQSETQPDDEVIFILVYVCIK